MPSMNQKVKDFLYEQKEFITEECIQAMVTLFERGPMNITFLADTINVKQHKMTPIIAVIEAFGFIELYKTGQSKEYTITDFGTDYLKQQDLLPEKKEEKKEEFTLIEPQTFNGEQVELLSRIFRLISIGKRNSIEEIAETIQTDIKDVKEILQHLTLAKMVKNTFKNRVRRYQLTELGESYYQFLRKQENEEEVMNGIHEQTPRLYETLIQLESGEVLYQEELEYANTLGLATGAFLTEQGKALVKIK